MIEYLHIDLTLVALYHVLWWSAYLKFGEYIFLFVHKSFVWHHGGIDTFRQSALHRYIAQHTET